MKFNDNITLFDKIIYDEKKNNLIGEFIFGDEPSNYENDNYYYNKKLYKVNTITNKDSINWELSFSNIYLTFNENENYSKIYFSGNKDAEIIINYSYMLAPSDFFILIKNKFFSKYIYYDICREKKINDLYTYIECDYDDSSFRVASFPDICLDHADLETSFILTYKDLFIVDKKNKIYIFLIFKKEYFMGWILGSIFLRKFQLIFDSDAKTIGYYKNVENNYDDIDYLKGINVRKLVKIILIFILIIIFSFLLVCLGMIIQKKYFSKNRKMRANELEENFIYEGKNNKLMIQNEFNFALK